MRNFILLSLLILLSLDNFAVNDTLVLTGNINHYDPTKYIKYFKDTSFDSSFEKISGSQFSPIIKKNNSNTINLGTSQSVYWFKLNLINNSNIEDWVLSIDYPTLNDVRIFIQNSDGTLDSVIYSGINFNKRENYLDDYSIYQTLIFKKAQSYNIYIRIYTQSFLILPISISTIQKYLKNDRSRNRMVFLLYGLVVSILILNLILFVLTWEINYFLLVLFLASLILNSFYLYGYGFEAFPNLSSHMKTGMRQILFAVSSILFLIFSINYLDLRKYKVIYNTIKVLLLICISLIIVVLLNIIPLSTVSKVSPILFLSGTIICFSFGIYTFRKNNRLSFYYLISFIVFLIASSIYASVLFNLIKLNFFTLYINLFSGSLFGILLTIGLIEKITALKSEKVKTLYLEKINFQLYNEIEERKKIETALRESEEKFRLFFNLTPLPVLVSDYSTKKIYDGNFKLFEILGSEKNEIIGNSLSELKFLKDDERQLFYSHIRENKLVSGEEFTFTLKKKEKITCLVYAQQVQIQGEMKLITILSDITQLKKSQQEIKKLSIAIDQSANSIIITNPEGIIEYVNNSFINNTGFSVSEVIGEKPSLLKSGFHPEEFYQSLWSTILSGNTWNGELYNRKKNGEFFWELSTISPIKDDKGRITNFLAIKENITEKKLQQDIIQESEKQLKELNATKDKFFSIIAHDLMNPLNALIGFCGLMIESVESNNFKNAANYAKIIDQTAKRIFDLLQNLLIWSRSQSGRLVFNPKNISIEELLLSIVDLMKNIASNKNVDINYQIKTRKKIFLDQNMISAVLRNLISNSIKFSEKGGKVKVIIQKKDTEFLFSIIDSGIGIEPDLMSDLFNIHKAFTKEGLVNDFGTGLGLLICKEFITIHNGNIWAESEKGKGSSFHFTIPSQDTDSIQNPNN